MTIKEMILKDELTWFFTKFSHTVINKTYVEQ